MNIVKKMREHSVGIYLLISLLLAAALPGCQVDTRPRLRISDYFGSPTEIRFPDPNDLGPHCLEPCPDEKLGLIYTCKAGFIDLGHLREAADRTHYAAGFIYHNILRNYTNCSTRIIEPSRYHLKILYPHGWRTLPYTERQAIAREISIIYGQYLAHTSLIWHEIITWYGFSSAGIFPENISAFSWEDPYSDVLGTYLGMTALGKSGKSFEKTMEQLIYQTLDKLDAQPSDVAQQAARQVKGEWFEGGYYFFVKMKKRNFDVGLDDGVVTPWLVPGICPDAVPLGCPVPNPGSILDKYGFKMRLEIDPAVFEKDKIYKHLNLKASERVNPSVHFPRIIEAIRKQAQQLDGSGVDTPHSETE